MPSGIIGKEFQWEVVIPDSIVARHSLRRSRSGQRCKEAGVSIVIDLALSERFRLNTPTAWYSLASHVFHVVRSITRTELKGDLLVGEADPRWIQHRQRVRVEGKRTWL